MTEDHPYYPGQERKYADLTQEQIPLTESLLDFMERTIPLWETKLYSSSWKDDMFLSSRMPTL
jgi:2,3-bisphosphoglycerate-dependent phosphoglycerate mutase